MLRLVIFLAIVVALAMGFSWLADRPGDIAIDWLGYHIETNVFFATILLAFVILLALMMWSLARHIWQSPASVGRFFQRRRHSHGLEALSSGMIAISAGDREQAQRYALQARKALPNEPLTHLLRAQAAQLAGDKATSRRIFEAMLGSPDTEQLGLRGLYLEAVREGEEEAALQFAQRAVKLNAKLEWPTTSLFELQCKRSDWQGALETLAIAKRYGHVEKSIAERRRAVLLSAQAQALEDTNPDAALSLALEAHGLAGDLIPAAEIAGRILASRGNTSRVAKVIQRTWKTSPHPDLALVYAYARIGDSPRDRLERVIKLAALNPHALEGPIAVASAAIEAKDFGMARHVLKPLLKDRLTQRVCTLMARIEGGEQGNRGAVREWLARAVNAPRDPAWTADGVVSEHWAPVSPVTGALDAFEWRVPVRSVDQGSDPLLASNLEELVALGAPGDFAGPASEPENSGSGIEARTLADRVTPEPARVDVVGIDTQTRERKGTQAQGQTDLGEAPVSISTPLPAKQPDVSNESPRHEKEPVSGETFEDDESGGLVPVLEEGDDDDIVISFGPDKGARKTSDGKADHAHAKRAPEDLSLSGRISELESDLEDVLETTESGKKPAVKSQHDLKISAKPSSRKPSLKARSSSPLKAGQAVEPSEEKISPSKVARNGKDTAGEGKGKKRPGERAHGASKDPIIKPEMFVSPRPPDDPGPDASIDLDERRPLVNPYSRKVRT